MYSTLRPSLLSNWSTFDRLFKELETSVLPVSGFRSEDVVQATDDDHATLRLALPGIDPKNIEVEINETIVTVTAEPDTSEVDATLLLDEFTRTRTRRSYRLGFRPDPKAVKATSKNGILTVELERAAADKPKKIKVLAA